MKSAYELAMERLEQQAPTVALTEEQKAALAEIDERFKAKIASRELTLKDLLAKAQAKGDAGEMAELEQELTRELQKLRRQCEEEKEAVRNEG